MTATPNEIAAQTAAAAAALLKQPHPELQRLQEAVKAAEGALGPTASKNVLRSFQGAEKVLREQRLKALLDALASHLAPLGLKIEGRILRRQPRKPRKNAPKPIADGGGEARMAVPSARDPAPATSPADEPRVRNGIFSKQAQ